MSNPRTRAVFRLRQGNCLALLRRLPSASVDAVITDPPYAEVNRSYGRLTESAWRHLMEQVVGESRRVLKPRGSAVYILQPNFRKLGSMRPWLWEFMAWAAREWNQVQDVWWWNFCTPPAAGAKRTVGLLRGSLKACVWLGPADCHRDQDAVLWTPADAARAARASDRCQRVSHPCGLSTNRATFAAALAERGGSTPFNVLPIQGASGPDSGGAHGHPAATPQQLCTWWVRYLTRPGDTVLDPFTGSGTVGISALLEGRSFIGFEQHAPYLPIARRRLRDAANAAR